MKNGKLLDAYLRLRLLLLQKKLEQITIEAWDGIVGSYLDFNSERAIGYYQLEYIKEEFPEIGYQDDKLWIQI